MNGKERPTTATRRARALELLASGQPPSAVAEQLGLAPRTIRHYLADPGVRVTLQKLRDERLRQLAGRALVEAGPALAILRQIAENPEAPASARVAAAGRLIDTAIKLMEVTELAERVEALEDLVEANGWRPQPSGGGRRNG